MFTKVTRIRVWLTPVKELLVGGARIRKILGNAGFARRKAAVKLAVLQSHRSSRTAFLLGKWRAPGDSNSGLLLCCGNLGEFFHGSFEFLHYLPGRASLFVNSDEFVEVPQAISATLNYLCEFVSELGFNIAQPWQATRTRRFCCRAPITESGRRA